MLSCEYALYVPCQFSGPIGTDILPRRRVTFNTRAPDLSKQFAKVTPQTEVIHIAGRFKLSILKDILRVGPNIHILSVSSSLFGNLGATLQIFCRDRGIKIVAEYTRIVPKRKKNTQAWIMAARKRNEHVLYVRELRVRTARQKARRQRQIERRRGELERKFGSTPVLLKLSANQFEAYETVMKAFQSGSFCLLERIDERAAKVLCLRFGLKDCTYRTLQTVGNLMGGITRERIRQLEERGLQKLRALP